ncbi:MAG: carbohydrate porin [Pseudomonadota bacterium]
MNLLLLLLNPVLADVSVGSYGRVQASTDLSGGAGDAVDVVNHGTRLEKDPYLELDIVLDKRLEDAGLFEVVLTPALAGDLFHYDGQWDADLALRNLYAEASALEHAQHLHLWAGSRMWRGDDVHLLDFWPLDELNVVGGGLSYQPEGWDLGLATGLNRLSAGEYQVQWTEVPEEAGVGSEPVLTMDRQRFVTGARAARLWDVGDGSTLRLKAYGELQLLPAASRVEDDWESSLDLPADRGGAVGLQLSSWGWAHDAFAHLFVRYATGLSAYGLLTVPADGMATDYSVHAAREFQVALSGNHETERVGFLVGGYLRRFVDADGVDVDPDDRWEGAIAVRPTLFLTDLASLGVELSQEVLRPDGLNPHDRAFDVPMVTKLAVLPAVQAGRGSLARPQLRLQYVLTYLNDDARLWFDARDTRSQKNVHHFLGVGAEWWLNSRSYR